MSKALLEIAFAFLGTLGFTLLFNLNKRDFFRASFSGALGWGCNLLVQHFTGSMVFAFFVASIVVGIYAEILGLIHKKPATIYIICGIIPLVPGGGMYTTMMEAVKGQSELALEQGFLTLSLAGAIASGLAVASAISRLVSIKDDKRYDHIKKEAKRTIKKVRKF